MCAYFLQLDRRFGEWRGASPYFYCMQSIICKDYATGIWHQLSSWFRTYNMFNTLRCLLYELFLLSNCISGWYSIIGDPLKLFIRDRYIHMPHEIDARTQSVIRMSSSEAENTISNFHTRILSTLHTLLWTPGMIAEKRHSCGHIVPTISESIETGRPRRIWYAQARLLRKHTNIEQTKKNTAIRITYTEC